tara:strand:+ start:1278 stop:1571 length:294 start_codon:yes stop_codon:yes gene_type:complete
MKKIFLYILCFAVLNGCTQYSSFVGPSYTIATTGNIYQASFAYSSGTILEKKTGKKPSEHVYYFIKKLDDSKKINQELIKLVETRIEKTRKKIKINY